MSRSYELTTATSQLETAADCKLLTQPSRLYRHFAWNSFFHLFVDIPASGEEEY